MDAPAPAAPQQPVDLSGVPLHYLQAIRNGEFDKVPLQVLQYVRGQPMTGRPTMGEPLNAADVATNAVKDTLGSLGKGALDTGLSAITGATAPIVGGALATAARAKALLTGQDPNAAADAAHEWVNAGIHQPTTPMGRAAATDVSVIPAALEKTRPYAAAAESGISNATGVPVSSIEHGLGAVNDVAAATPLGGAVRSAIGAGARAATSQAELLGFRTPQSSPVGRTLAGSSAGPALTAHNAVIGDTAISREAGLAHGTIPTPEALASAREAPGAVFDRVADQLPAGPLSPRAQQIVQNAGLPEGGRVSGGSPQAQAQIEQLRTQLLNPAPATGRQWVNESRGLRQEGYTNVASDDVSNQQLGRAQLDMARAVEAHIEDSLPQGSTTSAQQFQDARRALAKNYTAESALRGRTFDMKVLARVQRADPNILDGDMRAVADFANEHPEVAGRPSELNQPGIAKDIKSVSILNPVGNVTGALAGAAGRRMLTGGTGALQRANRFFAARPPPQFPPTPGVVPNPGLPPQLGDLFGR